MGKLSCNKNISLSFFLMLIFIITGHAQNTRTPQSLGAATVKYNNVKLPQKKVYKAFMKSTESKQQSFINTEKTGLTFKEVPFDEEHGVNTFTKKSAREYLDRDLFGSPEYTATYYYARYDKKSVVIENTYVQFVSDGAWDRVLYGTLQGALKSYNDISKPGEIAVNSAGYVFIVERGKARIQVLKIRSENEEVDLNFLFAIENTGELSSIAYNDGGTPFNMNDDFLFAANAATNIISKYKITENSAVKETEYKGFKWPVAITFGRWNGMNTGDLYVIDTYGRKVGLYKIDDENLTKILELTADLLQSFSAIETDHFGQVYIADRTNGEIFKYTSDLQLLDFQKAPYTGAHDINIPFGTVNVNGDKYWVGFDQVFMVQNWNNESGVVRYKLGIAIDEMNISLSEDQEDVVVKYNSTEFANRRATIFNEKGTVYKEDLNTMPSGENCMRWNRKNSNNQQAPTGRYTFNVELQSVYDGSIISKENNFYLPLYYHVNCGAEDNTPAISRVSGTVADYNGQKVVESQDKIIYQISGLDAGSEYKIAAKFLNGGNEKLDQQILIDGIVCDQTFEINNTELKTDFIKIPAEALADGIIQVAVQRVGTGNANISDLWIKETGREFNVLNAKKALPTTYQLSQNYPNPFNPQTTIKYQLVDDSRVTLKVYDITGREIKTLINDYKKAGEHQLVFDGSGLASGIYIYTLNWISDSGRKGVQSRKMILLK